MKKVFFIFFLSLFIFSACDYWSTYTFKVTNSTQEIIVLKFLNEVGKMYSGPYAENQKEVILNPNEEKIVRIIDGDWNSYSHDCLTKDGVAFFTGLVFDTYINGEKLEKQLWQAKNWTYRKISNISAEYNMIITDELIKE